MKEAGRRRDGEMAKKRWKGWREKRREGIGNKGKEIKNWVYSYVST